jgi:hypothetical protein
MSCPKTQHILLEYFSEDLAPLLREELEKHLEDCGHCSLELESLLLAKSSLEDWDEQSVPHWDRGLELFRREHRVSSAENGWWNVRQWLPTAASFAMLCVLLLNVNFSYSEQGFSLSFSADAGSDSNVQNQLAAFKQIQRDEMNQAVARMEDRQDSNNLRMMQAVLEQSEQSTAENLEQIYAYFEQQRLLDLQDMRTGYQQLVDSDYETIRSLQQLASFVSYQDDAR